MAAPNLLTSVTVTGKTAVANVTTSNTAFLTNATSSGTDLVCAFRGFAGTVERSMARQYKRTGLADA